MIGLGSEGGSFRKIFKLVRIAETKGCIALEIVGFLSSCRCKLVVGSGEVCQHFLSAMCQGCAEDLPLSFLLIIKKKFQRWLVWLSRLC